MIISFEEMKDKIDVEKMNKNGVMEHCFIFYSDKIKLALLIQLPLMINMTKTEKAFECLI